MWDRAYASLDSGGQDGPDPFASGINTYRKRLLEVCAEANQFRDDPAHANRRIADLHQELQAHFPDVPAYLVSKILSIALDPRFG